jgi:hypothetical protein
MINPPIKAIHCRTKRAVRVYGTTPDGMVLIAYNDTGKADVALWCDLEIPPEPEIVAVAAPSLHADMTLQWNGIPQLPRPSVTWGEWVPSEEDHTERYGMADDGTRHKQTLYPTRDGHWGWNWWRDGAICREQDGFSEAWWARRDCEDHTATHTAPKATP